MALEQLELSQAKTWAASHLHVEANAQRPMLEQAFLEQLDKAERLPTPAQRIAYQVLTNPQPDARLTQRARREMIRAHERQLHEEIRDFRHAFWDLPIAESTARWQELQERSAASPSARAHLEVLLPLLGMAAPEPPDAFPTMWLLIEKMKELMVSLPQQRPVRRQQFAAELQGQADYMRAAELLCLNYPDFANQEKSLLQRIQKPLKPLRIPVGSHQPAGPMAMSSSTGTRGSSWSDSWFAGRSWVLVVLVIGLLRACTSIPSSRESNRYSVPQFQLDPQTNAETWKTIEEKLKTSKKAASDLKDSPELKKTLSELYRKKAEADKKKKSQPNSR